MLKVYFKTAKSHRLNKIKKIREGAWINISEAEHEDLEKVAKLTDLEFLDLQDTLDLQELPRIERHKKSTLLFVRVPKERRESHDFIHTVPLAIVIDDKYFVTISPIKDPLIKNIQKSRLGIATTQRGKFLVYLLLKISQSFTREVKAISYEVASKKKQLDKIKDSDIGELIKYEDILNQYISALIPMRNVFENLINMAYFNFYKEDQDLFDDMLIAIRQSVDICQVNLKSIKSLRDSYQIVFTNRLNRVIKFLTSFTIIMSIPTSIASFFGMNVRLPFEYDPLAFVYIFLFSILVILLFLLIFYKKKWL